MELRASEITVRFAGLVAIDNVSLALKKGEIVGLVGPNGAGKTTMINVLSGFQAPQPGAVSIDGAPTRGRAGAWFARAGVVRTFQAVRLFRGLTVSENVEAALSSKGVGRFRARKRALEILDYIGVADRANRRADTLSYGDERRLGVARALSLDPHFLLLDEPAAGMNLAEASALSVLIRRIRDDFGCGVLLIEHNMRLVADACERVHALASGRTLAAGPPAEVMADERFRSAYLGSRAR